MDAIGNRSLRDLLREQAGAYGDKIFIVHETVEGDISQMSYAGMHHKA